METRIIQAASTAAADTGPSSALRSIGFPDELLNTPAESSRRAIKRQMRLEAGVRLRRLATKLQE
jgi:hypothetical protein